MSATKHRIAWAALASCLLHASVASGQALNFENLATGNNRLTVTMGLDPAILGAVTYTRTEAIANRPIAFSLEVAFPVAGLDVHDYRGALGAQMSALEYRRWHVAGHARLIARGTRNDIFDAHSIGADLTVSLGYYRSRWFGAFDLGFDKVVATYISHRDWYRHHFYNGAVDGWYSSTGGTWHAGLSAGVGFGKVELAAQASLHRSEGGSSLAPPVHGTLSCAYLF